MQAEQVPQSRCIGLLAGIEASVTTVPSSIQGPCPGANTIVLFPCQPTPARTAAALSTSRLSSLKISARYPRIEEMSGDRLGDATDALVLIGRGKPADHSPLL